MTAIGKAIPGVSPAPASVDAASPWPGLASFTEDSRAFFFGRERETDELLRLVGRQTLTVLFGQSGLGKSSLLQAGLFPRLRETDHLPLYLRLDHDREAPELADQVKAALQAAFTAAGVDATPIGADETLWEYFHRKDVDIWSAKNRLLTPVLAFDQFEEIFTLGRADDVTRRRSQAFLSELADLVENRPPAALQERLESGGADPTAYNYDKPSCRVILSLREDFLPDLEGLRHELPALIHNRLRLKRLNGMQALEAVRRPAPALLGEGVAEKIVEFVAGARGGSAERLAEVDVEPPLLSVICRELNERRVALDQAQITADLVSGNRREILHRFYERSVADLPERMRQFIEDRLLTKSGFRDNLALETALEQPGVTRALIDTLVLRRLLRIEDRVGVQRVELTHDVLAEVVRAARDDRQQRLALAEAARHTRRQRWVIAGLATAVAALVAGGFFGVKRQRAAEAAERQAAAQSSRTDFIYGSQLLEEDKVPEGLAYLVRAARSDPTNTVVGPRLVSALAYRSFADPIGKPLVHEGAGWASYLPGTNDILSLDEKAGARVWDRDGGRLSHSFNVGEVSNFEVSADGTRLAVCGAEGISIFDIATGRRLVGPFRRGSSRRGVVVNNVRFSPDGRWLASGSADLEVVLWDTTTGDHKFTLPLPHAATYPVFSPDSTLICTPAYNQREWRIWRVSDGTPVIPLQTRSGGNVTSGSFSPDGRLVIISDGGGAQVFEAHSARTVGPHLNHNGPAYGSHFTPDGNRVVTYSDDATVKVWDVPSGMLVATLPHGGRPIGHRIAAGGRFLITSCEDGLARVWDLRTYRLAFEPIRIGDVRWVDVAPEGREWLTVGRDGLVRRWRLEAGAVEPLQLRPDGSRLRVQRTLTGGSEVWLLYRDRLETLDVRTGGAPQPPRRFPVPIEAGLLSPEATVVAVTLKSGDHELWRLDRPEIVRFPLGKFTASRAVFSGDSSRFAVNESGDRVRAWDCATGALTVEVENKRLATFGSPFSPDGRKLLVYAQGEGAVQVIDTRTGGRLGQPLQHNAPLGGMNFSPDGHVIAVGFQDGAVRFWDAETTRPVGPTLVHRTWVRGVVFSHDGRRLLTYTPLQARVWDVATGAPLTDWIAAGNDVFSAVFSDDDTRFALRMRSTGAMRILGSQSGQTLVEPLMSAAGGMVSTFGFLDADRFLGIGGVSGELTVWPMPPQSEHRPVPEWLLQLASAVAGGELGPRGNFHERSFGAETFDDLRRELAAAPDDAAYVAWGRWFVADRATRSIGPGFTITRAEAAQLAGTAGEVAR